MIHISGQRKVNILKIAQMLTNINIQIIIKMLSSQVNIPSTFDDNVFKRLFFTRVMPSSIFSLFWWVRILTDYFIGTYKYQRNDEL